MSSYIFRVLDMVLRVLGFVHAHPSDDPVHLAATARLEERVARLKALLDQERNGFVTEGAATLTKQQRDYLLGELTAWRRDFATLAAQ